MPSSRNVGLQFAGPVLVALGGALLVGVPYLAQTLAREREEALAARLDAEARVAADALPWTSGPDLGAAVARVGAAIDAEAQSIEPLVERYRRDLANGIPDAPWPPVYPKMPDEAPRVNPSRARHD